ncbi:MAG: nitroreductase family protein [Gammaproteobacteria bacterium]|jgi:nitroreductase
MNTIEAIRNRRSTKKFDPYHEMPEEHVDELLSLAMLSPTAFNIQHWRFVVVRDKKLRESIRTVTWEQPQITDASLLIILCADTKAWKKQPERYWQNATRESREGLLGAIEMYYDGKEQTQRDEAIRSCGIAAQTIMLSATAMGYDSCPMDLSDFGEVAKLINLPDDHIISMFVAIGKGIEAPWPRGGQLRRDAVTKFNSF